MSQRRIRLRLSGLRLSGLRLSGLRSVYLHAEIIADSILPERAAAVLGSE